MRPGTLSRIGALVLRYVYLLRASWPRVVELAYWPTVQMILWGLISKFFETNSSFVAHAAGVLIAGVLLWDVLFRGQLGVSLMFFEEIYARNLAQLFASPLRPGEMVAGMLLVSLLRTLIGTIPAALLAIVLYHYSIFDMGLALIAFFVNLLVFGWAIGLGICALVLRYGMGAEGLAWSAIFALAPLSGIYYPIDTLPAMVRPLAHILPSSHVFEGMRSVLVDGVFRTDLLLGALLLNTVWFALGAFAFLAVFELARRRGYLLSIGD